MGHVPLLDELAIVTILAVIVTVLLAKLKLPTVAGLLAAGALLGPDTRVEPAPELSPLHLNEYAEAMQEHWQEGARFVITGCATYAGLPEDL